jgi:ribonuclease Y
MTIAVAILGACIALVATALIAARAAAAEAQRALRAILDDAVRQASATTRAAALEAAAEKQVAETQASAEAFERAAQENDALSKLEVAIDQRELAARDRQAKIEQENDVLAEREAVLDRAQRQLDQRQDLVASLSTDLRDTRAAVRTELEARGGVRLSDFIRDMSRTWIEEAQASAAAAVRNVEQHASDPVHDRHAKRVMEIAAARCSMHFLTERNASNIRCGADMVSLVMDQSGAIHRALERASNVQLLINDDKDAIRLDGLDGVGREVVRRALHRFARKPESIDDAKRDPDAWAAKVREGVQQEIRSLGKKAFQSLGLQKAHPEIVELVGALNFRTSYTQNQWLHAVEASFLAGMMAAELGLDEKLARRATLLHDIGKALTHKIEGSHAVIGAEIARRLGETEVVANAIGAHHADEPCNSVYAHLVAASDAMSGARPGARREQAEGFNTKIEDLERIALRARGVDRAHAVHGGRELRVYVREGEVDDLRVVEMSSDIAAQVSDEMTFPGQIKVTVIRSFEASSIAS